MAKRSTRKLQTIGLLSDPDAPLKSRPAAKRDKDQPRLPFDPMPQRIEPALALLAKKPPPGINGPMKSNGMVTVLPCMWSPLVCASSRVAVMIGHPFSRRSQPPPRPSAPQP